MIDDLIDDETGVYLNAKSPASFDFIRTNPRKNINRLAIDGIDEMFSMESSVSIAFNAELPVINMPKQINSTFVSFADEELCCNPRMFVKVEFANCIITLTASNRADMSMPAFGIFYQEIHNNQDLRGIYRMCEEHNEIYDNINFAVVDEDYLPAELKEALNAHS